MDTNFRGQLLLRYENIKISPALGNLIYCLRLRSFSLKELHNPQEMTMKARLVKNLLQIGHTARDFIRLVRRNENSSMAHTQSTGHAATQMLESFEEIKLQPHVQTVIPVKGLVTALTESLQDIPDLLTEDNGKMSGARLYVGCPVRVIGLPERKFCHPGNFLGL